MNPLYHILNRDYIQQQIQTHHFNQVYEVQKSTKALQDFLDSVDIIEPNYQQMASVEYCKILADYFKKHGMI